jgi:hypothetical protein
LNAISKMIHLRRMFLDAYMTHWNAVCRLSLSLGSLSPRIHIQNIRVEVRVFIGQNPPRKQLHSKNSCRYCRSVDFHVKPFKSELMKS